MEEEMRQKMEGDPHLLRKNEVTVTQGALPATRNVSLSTHLFLELQYFQRSETCFQTGDVGSSFTRDRATFRGLILLAFIRREASDGARSRGKQTALRQTSPVLVRVESVSATGGTFHDLTDLREGPAGSGAHGAGVRDLFAL